METRYWQGSQQDERTAPELHTTNTITSANLFAITPREFREATVADTYA